jgi:membrane fusion protein, multidrug efflux system
MDEMPRYSFKKMTMKTRKRWHMRYCGTTKLVAIVVMVLVTIIASGCKRKMAAPPPPEVGVVTLKPEKITITTELPGRVSPYLIAEVRPQVNGIVKKRLFTEGADVKAGEVLYQIDPAPYQAAFDNASASLARAEANLPPVRSKAQRYKELVAIKAVSQQEFEDVSAQQMQAEADVKYWKAAVETARINLEYTRIKAPIAGRIGKSGITVGALATANQATPFTTIQQLNPVYVDATQSSANLLHLKRILAEGKLVNNGPDSAKVKLLLEDGSPYDQEGTLKFSDITVEPSTGSFILRMVFPNPKHTLLPGMYARAVVLEGIAENSLLVPQQSVTRDPKGNPYVLIVNGQNKVEVRPVVAPRAMGDKWFITGGLQSGDKVIVEGIQKAMPGSTVNPVAYKPAAKPDAQAPGSASAPGSVPAPAKAAPAAMGAPPAKAAPDVSKQPAVPAKTENSKPSGSTQAK